MAVTGRISAARTVAVRTLQMLEIEPETLASEALAQFAAERKLSADDARLARTLVFGVLRTALTLDYYYGQFLTRPVARLDPAIRLLLRLAAYQHYYLTRIPDYAIANETIELGKRLLRLQGREIGFLNAVLRKMLADSAARELPTGNRVADLAVRYSFPPEVARLFVEKFGGHRAVEVMTAANVEPAMTVRANLLKTSRDALAARLRESGFVATPGELAPESLIVKPHEEGASLFDSAAFEDGDFYVQDEGSQMVAHVALPWARGRVLDLCAAPGGKSTHLAELTGGQMEIVATDVSARRLDLVRENVARLGTPGVRVVDLEDVLGQAESQLFGLVLVDAPCSGLGTVRRNPEVRYRVTPDALARQQARQIDALEQAADLVAPGGHIIYSTCSVSDAENRRVVDAFLAARDGWQIVNPAGDNEEAGLQRGDGFFATWPHWPGADGFEAVVLGQKPAMQ